MPTSIPYDPVLVLGNLVVPEYFQGIDAIAAAQAPIDAAEAGMNELIQLRRGLDMTVQDLLNLSIDPSPVKDKIKTLNDQIAAAAADYTSASLAAGPAIASARSSIRAVHHNIESPIDYNRTQIKRMPLSADSLRMNVQYFKNDTNEQHSQSLVGSISSFVSSSTEFLGDSWSGQATEAASHQASSQVQNHDIAGTLVVSIACTHKEAVLLAPFVLDVDKAIRAWNVVNPSQRIELDGDGIKAIAKQSEKDGDPTMSIISGATYGSSFVGMVHILNQSSTEAAETAESIAASMQGQFAVSGWFVNESGGFGVDSQMADDIKNLLSTQNVSAHVTLVAMGSIPSIKSGEVKIGVQEFADFDPGKMMDKLATMANATASDHKSVAASAEAARTGGQMIALQDAQVQSVMASLADMDEANDKVIDINSLMTALEDYVDKALGGEIGVPVNYYVKPITRVELAQMWVAKYFPDKFITISGDDTAATPATAPAAAPAAAPESGS